MLTDEIPYSKTEQRQQAVVRAAERLVVFQRMLFERKIVREMFLAHMRHIKSKYGKRNSDKVPLRKLYAKLQITAPKNRYYKTEFLKLPFGIFRHVNGRYYCNKYVFDHIDVRMFHEYTQWIYL